MQYFGAQGIAAHVGVSKRWFFLPQTKSSCNFHGLFSLRGFSLDRNPYFVRFNYDAGPVFAMILHEIESPRCRIRFLRCSVFRHEALPHSFWTGFELSGNVGLKSEVRSIVRSLNIIDFDSRISGQLWRQMLLEKEPQLHARKSQFAKGIHSKRTLER